MKKAAIQAAYSAGTALYFGRDNKWADYGIYYGEKVTVLDQEPGHWAWDREIGSYTRTAHKQSFGFNRTKTGYLVQHANGELLVVTAAQLRGRWDECTSVVSREAQRRDEADARRDARRAAQADIRSALDAYGVGIQDYNNDQGTVTVSAERLLDILKGL